MESLRNQIISCIESNQFSIADFNEDHIFDIFYDKNSEISIDRVLYELRTEGNTPKIVLGQLKEWTKIEQ
tara:strand:- start:166 stop:375 length:210 start_codon:yes stop_codon:yes gene_type:complete